VATEAKLARPPGITGSDLSIGSGRVQVLESCRGVWLFDIGQRRFCRVLPGQRPPPASDWSHFDELEIDPDRGCFAVTVGQTGTPILRSWFHVGECLFCSQPLQPGPERGPAEREESR
jgi:hypothetical protein